MEASHLKRKRAEAADRESRNSKHPAPSEEMTSWESRKKNIEDKAHSDRAKRHQVVYKLMADPAWRRLSTYAMVLRVVVSLIPLAQGVSTFVY